MLVCTWPLKQLKLFRGTFFFLNLTYFYFSNYSWRWVHFVIWITGSAWQASGKCSFHSGVPVVVFFYGLNPVLTAMTDSCAADRIKSKPLTWTKGCTSVAILKKNCFTRGSSTHPLIQRYSHTWSAAGFSAGGLVETSKQSCEFSWNTKSASWIWSLESSLWAGSERLSDDGWMMSSFQQRTIEKRRTEAETNRRK